METKVIIVGAGPAGLAASACLNILNIPNVVLEKDDSHAPLWKKRAYDRLTLHLAKRFCELPHMPYPTDAPTFVPRNGFIKYLDNYVSRFDINPQCNRLVESAVYDNVTEKWEVKVRNTALNLDEVYFGKFLVVATGENSEGLVPKVPGLDSFQGLCMHSCNYSNGKELKDKNVLVVGSGNSGMEISFDLYNWGAKTSMVARSPVHVVTKEIVYIGMCLLKFLPLNLVDFITVALSRLRFGDTSEYGLKRPKHGPFKNKATTGRTPTIDVGAVDKIKTKEIKVLPSITSIKGNTVHFENGESNEYDVIIFATGYRSTVRDWLKDGGDMFNENGMPKERFWKGEKGLYCAGFSQMGLMGISNDARNIAADIGSAITRCKKTG